MIFKDQMKNDAVNVFLNTGEFAENITYTPQGGSPKTIKAVVVLKTIEPTAGNTGRALHHQADVFILNDALKGIDAVDKKDDRLTLNDSEGNSQTARIHEVLAKDDGLWHLLVGW